MAEPGRRARRPLQRLTDAATVGGYRTGARCSPRALPGFVADGLGDADRVRRQLRQRRAAGDGRAPPAPGQPDVVATGRSARRCSRRSTPTRRYWIESLRLPSLSGAYGRRRLPTSTASPTSPTRSSEGKGVILALPHLGGWEWAGRWLADVGLPGHRRRRAARAARAVRLVRPPAQRARHERGAARSVGGDRRAAGAARQRDRLPAVRPRHPGRRRRGRVLRRAHDAAGRSGDARRCAPARRSCPSACYFTRRVNGHHAVVRPPIPAERSGTLREDVTRVTQHLARELEYLIRRAPEQWHLFQPNWPSDPGYRR